MSDIPVAGDPLADSNFTRVEREALRIEGLAQGMYEAHAKALYGRCRQKSPKWGWLTIEQRDGWRALAQERIDSEQSFNRDVVDGLL